MNDPYHGDNFARLADLFFNGRGAPTVSPEEKPPTVTIDELVRRKTSLVRFAGKLYRVRVTEVEEIR